MIVKIRKRLKDHPKTLRRGTKDIYNLLKKTKLYAGCMYAKSHLIW